MTNSPYSGYSDKDWASITEDLISKHPLNENEIVEIVLGAWKSIFSSQLGEKGFYIGKDIFPKPQIMGFLMHELIPLELAARYPEEWCGERNASDKDIVYLPDETFSIEVKTSSNPKHIYGNRSYAQKTSRGKKAKSGYYLAVNFEKFKVKSSTSPEIVLIRFGWLDSSDWIGQAASTGQQSRLPQEVEDGKLKSLYEKS